jgi:hypothetical protein
MAAPDRQWAIIRIRAEFPFLVVRYWDSSRRRVEKRREWAPGIGQGLPLDELIGLVGLPELLPRLFVAGAPALIPVPVFLDIPQMFRQAPFVFVPPVQPDAEFVQLSPARPMRRSAFRLPFRIVAVGDRARSSLTLFEDNYWYQADALRELGIRISSSEIEDLPHTLRRHGADILITADRRPTLRACRHLSEHQSPRLIIDLFPDRGLPGVPLSGTAELKIRSAPIPFLNHFLHELVHDQPLHAAFSAARRQGADADLIADPLSNQSLRLRDALLHLRHEAESVHPYDIEQRRRLDFISSPPDLSFMHERQGLVPMTRMLSAIRAEQYAVSTRRRDLKVLHEGRSVARQILSVAEPDRRVVNVGIRRIETEPLFGMIASDTALVPGAAYELKVDIGEPSTDSLVTGPQPPVGPLLPPTEDEAHDLEVAIQAKDFRLLSARVQRMRLPREGPCGPVYFRVRTPREASAAELRICIYFRNQLVQSYVLHAQIAPPAPAGLTEQQAANGVSVRLEYSRSKDQPWELDDLRPRDLSIGANQAGRTHQLIFKSSNTSGEVTLPDDTFKEEVQDLRAQLDSLIADSSGRERTYPAVSPGQQPAPDVADAFRALVRRGRDVYLAFSNEASKAGLKKTLLSVAAGVDQKLQVIRFVDQFAFLWTLLYDFPLPDERTGDPPLPVCFGLVTDAAGAVVACSHTNKDQVYCVRGFWGVRHFVEERLVQAGGQVTSLARPSQGPLRVVAAPNLAESANLESDIKKLESATETGPFAASSLLDLLWADPSERPAILILLAHFDEEKVPAEPEGPRVFLGGSEWLTLNQLSNRVAGSLEWGDPRPIIMQMTCNAAKVDSATVNHFMTQWNTAGAAAIIGTEARVGPGAAADCALSVTSGLWTGKQTLGEAVTAFRRKLVFACNPLGFLFTAYGDIDLVVP